MTTAAAYDDGRRRQQPTTTTVVAYNDGRRQHQPMTVAAAAYIDGSRDGVVARDGGHMHGWGKDKGAQKGGLRHDRQNNICSRVETSGARWGAFFGFSRPTLRQFF